MKLKEDKLHYARNFEFALIISLITTITVFVISPDLNNTTERMPYFDEPLITLVDIPDTRQSIRSSLLPPPLPGIPSQFIPMDEPEILADILIKDSTKEMSSSRTTEKSNNLLGTSKKIYEASSFPFVPRQILEVVPEKIDGAEGSIRLKLLIGKEGFVIKHDILDNTTNNSKCLTFVVKAVYKSRWQPVLFDGEKIDYWLEKTYVFN
ncbi:MAG: hypothetical protein AB1432_08985 [Bacteroidota bacterium]